MKFEVAATGFCMLEAPRADARGVWFSEMVLGGVRCLRPDGHVDAWLTDRKMIGGIALNDDGTLICSGKTGLVWLDPETGESGPLLEAIDGKPIPGVNDMAADGRGGVIFGTIDHGAMLAGEPFHGRSDIIRLDRDGGLTTLLAGINVANGIGVSPDGRRVYVNDTGVGTHEIIFHGDGSFDTRMFSTIPDCDGLAVDCEGGVWIAQISAGAVVRLNPDGSVDQTHSPNADGHVTSLCFGGPDGRDVYLTTIMHNAGKAVMTGILPDGRTASLFFARAPVPGLPAHKASIAIPRA